MSYIKTTFLTKTEYDYKLYEVSQEFLKDLGEPISREFYVGNNLLNNHRLGYTYTVTNIYFKISKCCSKKYLTIVYDYVETSANSEPTKHQSSFDYDETWHQGMLWNHTDFSIAWAEVCRKIYNNLGTNYSSAQYRKNFEKKYQQQFGTVLDNTYYDKEELAIQSGWYNDMFDLVLTINIKPISVPKYIGYYKQLLKDKKADFTDKQLELYEKYVMQEFSHYIVEHNTNGKYNITDYCPSITVDSFEYFNFKLKQACSHANDFTASKELIQKLNDTVAELGNISCAADIYGIN